MTYLVSRIWMMNQYIVVVDRWGLPHLGWLNTWWKPRRLSLPGLVLWPAQGISGPPAQPREEDGEANGFVPITHGIIQAGIW